MTIMSIRSELDNLGKTAAACKTIINDCVIEIESSTAKWSFSSSSGGQGHPTQHLECLRMLRKEPSMTIFWCNFKHMILLIVTRVILEGYIPRACQI